jgi:hypothetical protein
VTPNDYVTQGELWTFIITQGVVNFLLTWYLVKLYRGGL